MFRKVNKSQGTIRKRVQKAEELASSSSSSNDNGTENENNKILTISQKRKQIRQKNMIQTTSKKRQRQLDNLNVSSSSENENNGESEIKYDINVKFASNESVERAGPSDMGATARCEIDSDQRIDAQAQFERVQQQIKEREAELTAQGPSGEKIYRGMALYGAKIKQDSLKGNASSGLNRNGPIRASQFMRASVRWDYAPDVCKDYKETGYCTFGDSCKFMHDRSDYKHGWEIERDYEAGRLKEAKDDEYAITSEDDEVAKKELPFNCFICRDSFKNPVVTKCKHYFCENCALTHFRKSKKCAVCGLKTDGVFVIAKEITENSSKEKKDDSDLEEKKPEAVVLSWANTEFNTKTEVKFEPVEENELNKHIDN